MSGHDNVSFGHESTLFSHKNIGYGHVTSGVRKIQTGNYGKDPPFVSPQLDFGTRLRRDESTFSPLTPDKRFSNAPTQTFASLRPVKTEMMSPRSDDVEIIKMVPPKRSHEFQATLPNPATIRTQQGIETTPRQVVPRKSSPEKLKTSLHKDQTNLTSSSSSSDSSDNENVASLRPILNNFKSSSDETQNLARTKTNSLGNKIKPKKVIPSSSTPKSSTASPHSSRVGQSEFPANRQEPVSSINRSHPGQGQGSSSSFPRAFQRDDGSKTSHSDSRSMMPARVWGKVDPIAPKEIKSRQTAVAQPQKPAPPSSGLMTKQSTVQSGQIPGLQSTQQETSSDDSSSDSEPPPRDKVSMKLAHVGKIVTAMFLNKIKPPQAVVTQQAKNQAPMAVTSATKQGSNRVPMTTAHQPSTNLQKFGQVKVAQKAAPSSGGSSATQTAPYSRGSLAQDVAPPSRGSSAQKAVPPFRGSSAIQAAPYSRGSSAQKAVPPLRGSSATQAAPSSRGPSAQKAVPPFKGSSAIQAAPYFRGSSAQKAVPPFRESSATQAAQPTRRSLATQAASYSRGSSAQKTVPPSRGSLAQKNVQPSRVSLAQKAAPPSRGSSAQKDAPESSSDDPSSDEECGVKKPERINGKSFRTF